ncbi:hypothetical protein [Rufibacter roseus]|uniref:tRNA (Guanine-N1)-methyltransferase n=1 Tax=Rufibacter roseus TaxID=1567108 RepID=A0ABW2DMH6_9BACT|nr:hypothetical protein [Rufibacter roseus]
MKALTLSLIFCAVVVTSGLAQTQTAAPAQNRSAYTLQQQFNSMKFSSSPYKEFGHDYRVVRESRLEAFLKSVQDTLKVREQSIKNAGKETAVALEKTQKELEVQKAQVQALQQDNAKKEQQLQQFDHDISHLSVLGLDMDKQLYVVISLAIIVGLGAMAAVFAFMFKNSNSVTQQKIKAYEELDQELKDYKTASREREIKLKREMQSEANKVEDLKQELAELRKRMAV